MKFLIFLNLSFGRILPPKNTTQHVILRLESKKVRRRIYHHASIAPLTVEKRRSEFGPENEKNVFFRRANVTMTREIGFKRRRRARGERRVVRNNSSRAAARRRARRYLDFSQAPTPSPIPLHLQCPFAACVYIANSHAARRPAGWRSHSVIITVARVPAAARRTTTIIIIETTTTPTPVTRDNSDIHYRRRRRRLKSS